VIGSKNVNHGDAEGQYPLGYQGTTVLVSQTTRDELWGKVEDWQHTLNDIERTVQNMPQYWRPKAFDSANTYQYHLRPPLPSR
jgi:hypothetical protein